MKIAGGKFGCGLGGFSVGYQSANPGMGLLGGILNSRNQVKEARRELEEKVEKTGVLLNESIKKDKEKK